MANPQNTEQKSEPKGRPYPVAENLRHNGVVYGKGDTVEMSAKDAKPLIDAGVLGKPAAKAGDAS